MSEADGPDGIDGDPTHVTADERAAGLGYGRSERRRRASLAPLIFLIAGALLVGVFAFFRGTDELSSRVELVLVQTENGPAVVSTVSITNQGLVDATILSVDVNAGGAIVLQDVQMKLLGEDDTVGLLDELVIPPGRAARIDYAFTFECTDGGEFFIDIVVRVQVKQKGLFRIFNEPDDNTDGPRYMCVDGSAVEAGATP